MIEIRYSPGVAQCLCSTLYLSLVTGSFGAAIYSVGNRQLMLISKNAPTAAPFACAGTNGAC